MGSNTNKRKSAKRGILIALVVFLSIVLAVLLVGTIFASRLLNSINQVSEQETMSQEQIDAILGEYQARSYINSKNMSFANAMFIRDGFKDSVNENFVTNLNNNFP